MKTTFSFFVLIATFCFSAIAQPASFSLTQLSSASTFEVPEAADTPFIHAYIADPFEARSEDWWKSLGTELSLVETSYKRVTPEALQNLIFFQTNHAGQVDVTGSIPTLLDIYQYHKSSGMRIMAIAALVEIGDEEALKVVEKNLYKQRVEQVSTFAKLALASYYK